MLSCCHKNAPSESGDINGKLLCKGFAEEKVKALRL
jgi:hypothetical protein